MKPRPVILFVCVHNAGRSQMAAAFARHLGAGSVDVRSAGSAPGERVNPVAVAAMAELGIPLDATPRRLSDADLAAADVVVTMGCGDACVAKAGARREDWPLEDPAGKDLAAVRRVRDAIREKVRGLLASLGGGPGAPARG